MHLDLFQKKEEAMISLLTIEESWKDLPDLKLGSLNPDQTAVVFVDVIEGFVNLIKARWRRSGRRTSLHRSNA